jgi:outer membrane murein-binding lipoprotein Lpp
MKFYTIAKLILALVAVVSIGLSGCSDDNQKTTKSSIVNEVVDSLASAVSDNLSKAYAVAARQNDSAEESSDAAGETLDIADMVVVDSTVYAVVGENLLIYSLGSRGYETVPAGETLNAVAYHAGKIYVGGASLFTVTDVGLEPVDIEVTGVITDLYSFEYRLMIGTKAGLFSKSIFGNERLFDDISVTAMTADANGLWVGTDGQGLYRWDGSEFTRRYLYRDTGIFDNVQALDFNHDHLYLGTADGFYIFDGGRWETITTENGLPSNDIRAIDASDWVVYLATSDGVVSWFNGDVLPVKKIGDMPASLVRVDGRKIFVASPKVGLLMKSGPVVATLLEPDNENRSDPVALTLQ